MKVKDLKIETDYIISEYQINTSNKTDRDIYRITVMKKTKKATKIAFEPKSIDAKWNIEWLLNNWDITVIEEIED